MKQTSTNSQYTSAKKSAKVWQTNKEAPALKIVRENI